MTPTQNICCRVNSSSSEDCLQVCKVSVSEWRGNLISILPLEARQRLVDRSGVEEADALGGAIWANVLAWLVGSRSGYSQANCVGTAMTSQSHSRGYRVGVRQDAGGRESESTGRLQGVCWR